MNLLSFDTSTEACSAAIKYNEQIVHRFQIAPRQHAEMLLPMIQELLQAVSGELQNLEAIAFGQGPGSFMGVRIAAAVAQSLGFAATLPVIPLSTLQALAQHAYLTYHCEYVIAAWDARMGEIYWGVYHLGQDQNMVPFLKDSLMSPQDFIKAIWKISSQRAYFFAGDAWEIYQAELIDIIPAATKIVTELYPTAQAMLTLAESALKQGKVEVAQNAEPIYLRNDIARPSIKIE